MILESLSEEAREEEFWLYKFNDLILKTDGMGRAVGDRVIPLGEACGIQMEYMAHHPEIVQGESVFEPFCGSGPLGLAALIRQFRGAL